LELSPTGRGVHPCVYLTPEDVNRARRNAARHSWAKEFAEQTISAADEAAVLEPEWIRQTCPEPGAAFAYGFTGCPICSAKWGTWGGADCSLERPGTVRCANGHLLPDADHPDPGTGYQAEDGRIHYFVGSYNAWVVETYQTWCDQLSMAFTLTGEERYARTCAILLDALAEIYPACDKGSWDYPSEPPSGRLCRPWYQVSRVLVTLVDYYDRIYHIPALDEASFAGGLSRRTSIEQNMLENGARYCYEQSLKGGMSNGQADYVRGSMAVGCLLGIQEYVDWAVDGPYGIRAMTSNNSDRDGRYSETSLGYARHARELYLTFAEPLLNYRSDRYPDGLNLYDDPVFRSFYALPILSVDCAGHWPRYGDWGPDTERLQGAARPFDASDYRFAERICARTTLPDVRQLFARLVGFFGNGDLDRLRASEGETAWLLFHADESPQAQDQLPPQLEGRVTATSLLGQKGFALLRTPAGELAQACLLRYGPVLGHGHYDDLNINYFGQGYEVTYDLGYGNGATATQNGWAKQTAAHQLVLVDEVRQQNDREVDNSGGSLHLFAGMPGLQVVDADANGVYRSRGVTCYQRLVALVDDGPGSYLLDVFRVRGGAQHDYLAHALSTDVCLDGVSMGEREEGSVAGPEYNWGERQLNDGYLEGIPQKHYWAAPPGNGLGFMMHPRRGAPDGTWSATWRLPDGDSQLRMTVLAEPGDEVINSWAPGIYPHQPAAEHVMVRRRAAAEDLESTFVSVREPFTGAPAVSKVSGIRCTDGATAVEVQGTGDRIDRFVYAGAAQGTVTAQDVRLDGSLGRLTYQGTRIVRAHLIGTSLCADGFQLALASGHEGSIIEIDYEQNQVHVDADLPVDGRLEGQAVTFGGPAYSRNTAYTIHRVFRNDNGTSVIDLGSQRIILGQGTLGEDPADATRMTSLTLHDYALSTHFGGPGFFDGKMIVSSDGRHQTRIQRTKHGVPFELTVESTRGFRAGDTFHYLDLFQGDDFKIHNWAAVDTDAEGQATVVATDDVGLTLNGHTRQIPWSGS
jgi:hypothetical protein